MERIVSKQLHVNGMTCGGCANKIEKNLKEISGITKVRASYSGSKVSVTYDEEKTNLKKIKKAIAALDYQVLEDAAGDRPSSVKLVQLAVIAFLLLGAYLILDYFGFFHIFSYFPEAKEGMSYAALFVIGLLTSVHCVGMCGGICLSQCVNAKGAGKTERMRPSLLYNAGRVVSYTVVGAIVGALGSIISFSGVMRGVVALFAGVFMVIMGLNMLNLFPWLKRLQLRLPKFLTRGMEGKSNSPFYIGLLNGLMPCGPLQAMQLYALSTGDPVKGALSMLLFSLGTSPLLFGFGAASSLLSKKFTAKMMAISAVLVILLGAGMFNTGLSMSGFVAVGTAQSDVRGFQPVMQDGFQVVTIEVAPRGYAPITVKKGIPVKFNLHVDKKNLNGCNNAIVIPQFGIQKKLSPGDNIVSFTPTETGTIPYSCWMNMIRSSITVVE